MKHEKRDNYLRFLNYRLPATHLTHGMEQDFQTEQSFTYMEQDTHFNYHRLGWSQPSAVLSCIASIQTEEAKS